MFSYRMSRLPFFIWNLVFAMLVAKLLQEEELLNLFWLLLVLPIFLVFIVLPRLRDCGWPQWLAVVSLIPVIGHILSLTFAFAPTKVDFSDPEENEAPDFNQLS